MTDEEAEMQKTADEIRGRLQGIGRTIKKELPEGWGFTLLVASHGPKGITLYISTIERADSLQVMREFIANQKEERNWFRDVADPELTEDFEHWWIQQNKRRAGKQQPLKQWCQDAFYGGRASA